MDYKESQVTGRSWRRCHLISIHNPLPHEGAPSVYFEMSDAVNLAERTLATPAGGVAVAFDPARVIPLLDPTTGEPTGREMSYGEVYAILYSAFIDAAVSEERRIAREAEEIAARNADLARQISGAV